MNRLLIIVMVSIILLVFLKCDVNEKSNEHKTKPESKGFTFSNKPLQKFDIFSNKDTIITGNEGTQVVISANTFEFENGDDINQKISIFLNEYYTKSDMLMAGLTTTSSNNILVSGGMIFISAESENKPVKIKNGKQMEIKFNQDYALKDRKMKPFIGIVSTKSNEAKKIDWIIDESKIYSNDTINSRVVNVDFGQDLVVLGEQDYIFISTSLGWINADIFYENEDNTLLMVNVDTSIFILPYMVFDEMRTILPGYIKDNKAYFNNVPVGQKVSLIFIGGTKNKPYMGKKRIRIKKNDTDNIVMKETTVAIIESEIKEIDNM